MKKFEKNMKILNYFVELEEKFLEDLKNSVIF